MNNVTIEKPTNVPVHLPQDLPTSFVIRHLHAWYGEKHTLHDINITICQNQITAIIGPSGCGKSTFIRCLNRINELIPGFRMSGEILFKGQNINHALINPIEIRYQVGMVFQKPNPFPKTIYENVAYGPRVWGVKKKSELDEQVETSLRGAALWDEVKDKLHQSALFLSGGQQQRLCIARALAVEPEVLLLDEPCSALDPIATGRIEELLQELKKSRSIVLVTHNMQQAARVADFTGFFLLGELIEYDHTSKIFTNPTQKKTEDYITGRFG